MRSLGLLRWALNAMVGVLIKDTSGEHRDTVERPHEIRDRYRSDGAT